VYGETSFELINQMIDQISPIIPDNKFLDLGSGVGQVQYPYNLHKAKMCDTVQVPFTSVGGEHCEVYPPNINDIQKT
jgi:hypothetical protein